MLPRFLAAILITVAGVSSAAAQSTPPAGDIQRNVDSLFSFDYPTRMNAARALAGALLLPQPYPRSSQAARGHSDEFVRYRALWC